ncbi:MAG: prolipoprotein diacylglyceryl transferase [Gammaproteobacteria bacterium]
MIIHPNFDPVALRIGPLSVHWYGLMYLAAFAAAGMLGRWRAARGRHGFAPGEITDLVFVLALGAVIGGRLGYVLFYHLAHYFANPLEIFAIWDGGMSFHGGLLGVLGAVWWVARKTDRAFLDVCDFLAPLCAPGLGFGRLGNFINQELWGRVTDARWAVWFHTTPDAARHPSQLYEFALEGVVLFALVWVYSRRPRARGRVAGLFALLYGVFRFALEFFREPDAHLGALALGLSMGQLLCLPMILLGAFFFLRPAARAK